MIFKRRKTLAVDHQANIAAAIMAIRKASRAGLDYEKMFRNELEEQFDCRIPATLSVFEFLAAQAEITGEMLKDAVRSMVDGANPETYRWLGMKKSPTAFYSIVAMLSVILEKEPG